MMTYYMQHDSPLGSLLLAATDQGLSGIYFEEHRHFNRMHGWQQAADHAILQQAASQLDDYFAQRRTVFDLPLDLMGTEFQRTVWQALLDIPFGHTVSYMQHAQRIGNPKALRAVGAAIGRNPVSIIVPCHRVIGASRAPTGYAGGLARKCSLLALEGIQLS
jgi:methylated-DNA-[protein]-cysteine S-methyltransferase